MYQLIEQGVGKRYDVVFELGLKEKGVELSPMTYIYTKDLIRKAYLDKVDELRASIISGEIVVEDPRK